MFFFLVLIIYIFITVPSSGSREVFARIPELPGGIEQTSTNYLLNWIA